MAGRNSTSVLLHREHIRLNVTESANSPRAIARCSLASARDMTAPSAPTEIRPMQNAEVLSQPAIALPPCFWRGQINGHKCECNSPRMASRVVDVKVCSGEAWGLPACKYADPDGKDTREGVPQQALDCIHRGEQTRTETCQMCGGHEREIAILSCDLYGECSMGRFKQLQQVQSCVSCPDRS